MKRIIIASILGIAASVRSSYGQGQVIFDTYFSSAISPIAVWTYTSATPPPGHTVGSPIVGADNFTATLYYGIGSGLPFSALIPVSGSATPVGTLLPGAIVGPAVTLPLWTPGNSVTFGIHVDNGLGGSSTIDIYTWTEPASTIVSIGNPVNNFTPSLIQAAYPSSILFPNNGVALIVVPEPGMAALTGLGIMSFLISRKRR